MLSPLKNFNEIPHSRKNSLKFIQRFLSENSVIDKTVIDLSAGVGFVANLWQEAGAKVEAYDLYPDLLRYENIVCKQIDLSKKLPIASNSADYVLLMETIEHISDQQFLFDEISRILKPSGTFILTKPNNSSISGRLANLWTEAERGNMFLPNEQTYIGYDDKHAYNARFFLLNAQRLRTLTALSGLQIEKIYANQISISSVIWYVFIGIFFHFRSFLTLKRQLRKAKNDLEKTAINEQYLLNIDSTILLHKHLCITFKKK